MMRASSQPLFSHILTLLTHSHSFCHIWPQLLPHLLTFMFQVPHNTTIHYLFGNIKVCLLLPSRSLIPQLPRIFYRISLAVTDQISHIISSFISIHKVKDILFWTHPSKSCGGGGNDGGGARTRWMWWESCHENRVVAWWKGAVLYKAHVLAFIQKSLGN